MFIARLMRLSGHLVVQVPVLLLAVARNFQCLRRTSRHRWNLPRTLSCSTCFPLHTTSKLQGLRTPKGTLSWDWPTSAEETT